MIVYEANLKGNQHQYERLNEAIRTGLFIGNSCLRFWEDGNALSRYDLYKYVTRLAKDAGFPWAKKLNSQARQAMAERTWAAISRFSDNLRLSAHVEACKKQIPGKKGYPKYKKNRPNHGSVEYKVTGWKLSENRDRITFTDGFKAGGFKLYGSRDLKVRNMVKNHKLAKSISDASWTQFRTWLEYFGKVFGTVTVAIPPHYTSQNCSNCGTIVKKSLSTRTHKCGCGTVLDRDENAAKNILKLGLRTVGHTGTFQSKYWINASGQMSLWCLDESQYTKFAG
ncbi:MAG: transposase [Symploca sp. SIO2E9]|nr:transposase [Symploca sp. SIO2E9]